jgi:hypothetical protein
MLELVLMLSIPPFVGIATYLAVRWRWARQEQKGQTPHREPRLN